MIEIIFFVTVIAIFLSSKIKSAATEVAAQKTQTPIVAKLTQCEMGAKAHTNKGGICIFIKFTLFVYAENGTFIPKKKNAPNFTSIKLVWHNYYNAIFYVCKAKSAWTKIQAPVSMLLICFCGVVRRDLHMANIMDRHRRADGGNSPPDCCI